MNPQDLFNVAGAIILAVGGWFARQLWDAVKKLQADIQRIEVDLPKSYVSKTDWTGALEEIGRKLDKISDKIDGKADK